MAVELGDRVEFGGLSFQIPSGWVARDASNGGMYYYASESDQSVLMHVYGSDLEVADGNESLAFSKILEGLSGKIDPKPEDTVTTDLTISGYPAQKATFTGGVNGAMYSFRFLSVLHDGQVAMMMGASPLDGASYDETFDACIDSVQVVADAKKESESAVSAGSAKNEEKKASKDSGKIDADKFAAIEQGMSYEDVVGIIGSEGELVSSSSIAGIENTTYTWKSDGWGIATVMFQDGAVVNKSQAGVGGSSTAQVTMETFNQVENGMSYDQVVEVLGGEGELVSETELAGIKMSIYSWDGNSTFSSCQITFQDGAVSSKSQYGLK
ncbi:MAG: DUF3862 domain-containing protein [Coriobacteriia bacterium]|nr:DUF3862 domain-containing protein [Coriobacteriia bacterium]